MNEHLRSEPQIYLDFSKRMNYFFHLLIGQTIKDWNAECFQIKFFCNGVIRDTVSTRFIIRVHWNRDIMHLTADPALCKPFHKLISRQADTAKIYPENVDMA